MTLHIRGRCKKFEKQSKTYQEILNLKKDFEAAFAGAYNQLIDN